MALLPPALAEHPVCHVVLEAYRHRAHELRTTQAEFDGWIPRLRTIDGIEGDELPRAHGKLIAMGLLKFQLADRFAGMQYQISLAGRQVLGEVVESVGDDEPDDADGSDAADD